MINNNDKTNKNWNCVSYRRKQHKHSQTGPGLRYYYRKKSLQPPIEFDKDLDYLVATRNTVISVVEFVLRDE